jgi:superfamily II DNA or RNA helicase
MARHHLSEPRVQKAVEQLVRLYLKHQSVNAVHRVLKSGVDGAKTVYPNRIHTLLSDDPSKSVNTDTLEAVEAALSQVDVPSAEGLGSINGKGIYQDVLQEHSARQDLYVGREVGAVVDEISDRLPAPEAVVRSVLEEAGRLDGEKTEEQRKTDDRLQAPDWSFQTTAVRDCVRSLLETVDKKSGLVVPTGGGKTRIAIRVILQLLARAEREDTVALWVTHRHQLRRQARRELQRVLDDEKIDLPDNAAQLLDERLEFVMRSNIASALQRHGTQGIELVVVDEAHHAAAPSYQPIFEMDPLRGLFLTATPNRADNLPIGIDEIAYRTTYRDLFERGVIVEPTFEELPMRQFDWEDENQVADLANNLIEKAADNHKKILVAVSRTRYTIRLREALVQQLEGRTSHPLDLNDIGYVHGQSSSTGAEPLNFIDEFNAHPRGILVATSQLIGEGYDDASIDTVVVTYPSMSVGHLMQVAGRALRVAPGKDRAYVIQMRKSKVTYHFEQGWLYQDISDRLHPQLEHVDYSSVDDLERLVRHVLEKHNVSETVKNRVLSQVEQVGGGERYNLLLTGLPYFGDAEDFGRDSQWGSIFIDSGERPTFRTVYNEYSDLGEEIDKRKDFLRKYISPDSRRGSRWKGYLDMLEAMDAARKEIKHDRSGVGSRRNYQPQTGTSWLKYYTFEYRPDLPEDLKDFLGDAINQGEVTQRYLKDQDRWAMVLKVPLPLTGTKAFLLSPDEAEWFTNEREELIEALSQQEVSEGFSVIGAWRRGHDHLPVSTLVMENIDRFLRVEEFNARVLDLEGDSS